MTGLLRAGADQPTTSAPRQHNAHVHLPPNFSAFVSPADAASRAADAGLALLGASNYYDYAVYAPFAEACLARGVFPLFGLEVIGMDNALREAGVKLNDPANPGKVYLCGKALSRFDPAPEPAARILDRVRRGDGERMAQMARLIGQTLQSRGVDVALTADDIAGAVAGCCGVPRETVWLQERHLAEAYENALRDQAGADPAATFSKALDAEVPPDKAADPVAVQGLIRSALMKTGKPAYVAEPFISAADAREMILAMGGIPAYPVLADGAPELSGFERDPQTLADNVRRLGFVACEFIPSRNSADLLAQYVPALREAGLVVTAGTEHNTQAMTPLGLEAKSGAPVPERVLEIFWEGARVAAAHQVLTADDQPGLDPDAPADDATIRRLADLGAGFIHQTQSAGAPR